MKTVARENELVFHDLSYGGDYSPEQWSEEVWAQDARLMREAGVNLVSLGVFAWGKLEPRPAEFNFAWLDRVMELLAAHGVRVALATPTAAPPPWLVHLHPEVLPVTADGVTLWHGSRRHYCPHSAAYREHAARIVSTLAQHMREHPALALWHVDNEYACHVAECFCDASAAAFRRWLQERYPDIQALNEAWGTAFWSQHYGEWEEIAPPRRAPAPINPSQLLDWRRFCSDSWLACFEDQRTILRGITPAVPITTNFMGFFKPLDYFKWAAREDIVANDAYPDPSDPEWMFDSGMMCDLIRSLRGGRPWLLMEQAPTHVNWRTRNATKRPGVMRLASYQAIARGANGVMFFQWRASRAGAEKFHSGMVPHAGTDSRVWREVKSLGTELRSLAPLLSGRVQSEVAILFDWENWWALEEKGKPCNDLTLLPQVRWFYAELSRRHIPVDFVHPEADLTRHRLLLAPHLYLVSDRAVQNIDRFVANGGVLLTTFFSGIVDTNDHVRLGGYPAPFRDLLGLWVEEFVVYPDTRENSVQAYDRVFGCRLWSDVLHTTTAEVLARYREDYFAGSPAITRQRSGQGTSYYLGTVLDDEGLAWLFDRVCDDAEVRGFENVPSGVELVRRTDDTHAWLFVLNHSDAPVEIPLSEPGLELLTGAPTGGTLHLGPLDVAIVQSPATVGSGSCRVPPVPADP
ncbi:MAG: beta-galactosidase [Chloroflexi bacterium]|nr:beta-galactosidase [Chloroflexota bacterium]